MKLRKIGLLLLSVVCAASCSFAHVGSPDVFFQGNAGPYHMTVMVRTPQMIPGIAEIEVRSDVPGISSMKATPLYIVGSGSKYPPAPDDLQQVPGDPQSFTGKLWLMDAGSWEVRLQAEGSNGAGTLAVPVAAFARSTMPMQKWLGTLLLSMMMLLIVGLISIFGAARREGALQPGLEPAAAQKREALRVMGIALVLTIVALALGNWWWDAVAADNTSRKIYQPPKMDVSLDGSTMTMRIADSAWHLRRPETVMTQIIPDHGHLMHLFLVSPQMDRMYHLHPEQNAANPFVFTEKLPPVAPGQYKLFADIVRASGFPDTMVADVNVTQTGDNAFTGDDSSVAAAPLTERAAGNQVSPLSADDRMVWERAPGELTSNQLLWFKFRVEDLTGKPVNDLEPYMGMAVHAEFVASDFSVFAHVHPDGSVSMAALDLASRGANASSMQDSGGMAGMAGMAMLGMTGAAPTPLPPEVSFPYGFPKAGLYRIFVQVKRKEQVETGVFDAKVN